MPEYEQTDSFGACVNDSHVRIREVTHSNVPYITAVHYARTHLTCFKKVKSDF